MIIARNNEPVNQFQKSLQKFYFISVCMLVMFIEYLPYAEYGSRECRISEGT